MGLATAAKDDGSVVVLRAAALVLMVRWGAVGAAARTYYVIPNRQIERVA
jgi:hypothetical protein